MGTYNHLHHARPARDPSPPPNPHREAALAKLTGASGAAAAAPLSLPPPPRDDADSMCREDRQLYVFPDGKKEDVITTRYCSRGCTAADATRLPTKHVGVPRLSLGQYADRYALTPPPSRSRSRDDDRFVPRRSPLVADRPGRARERVLYADDARRYSSYAHAHKPDYTKPAYPEYKRPRPVIVDDRRPPPAAGPRASSNPIPLGFDVLNRYHPAPRRDDRDVDRDRDRGRRYYSLWRPADRSRSARRASPPPDRRYYRRERPGYAPAAAAAYQQPYAPPRRSRSSYAGESRRQPLADPPVAKYPSPPPTGKTVQWDDEVSRRKREHNNRIAARPTVPDAQKPLKSILRRSKSTDGYAEARRPRYPRSAADDAARAVGQLRLEERRDNCDPRLEDRLRRRMTLGDRYRL